MTTQLAPPSLSAHTLYTADLQHIADLVPDEVQVLVAAIAAGGLCAERARHRIIEGMQRRIWRMAQRFARQCTHLTALDLAQEATLGLLEALPALQPQATAEAFFFWATIRIRSSMIAAYWRDEVSFGLSKRQINRLRATRTRSGDDTASIKIHQTPENCSLEHWIELRSEEASPLNEQGESDTEMLNLFAHLESGAYRDLYDAIDKLSTLERQVIVRRYGLRRHAAASPLQVGHQLHLSSARVQALERLACAHLRATLTRPTNGVA
jgi:RNA polymerase nonessential primary-like sigma factor